MTNSERRISRQRAFLPMPGEARPDWWQLAEVARLMGFGDAFGYRQAADIFGEYARLSGMHNAGTRDLDISAHGDIDRRAYDNLAPFQWPQRRGEGPKTTRFFADGRFYTPDGRARFVATPYRAPAQAVSPAYPLVLNSGRIRDQWHTMTRTGKAARLTAHMAEPFVELHPANAARAGLVSGDIAEVRNANGRVLVRAVVTESQQQGSAFVPMHWTDEQASAARIDALVGGATDPISGQPELKHTGIAVRRFEARWHGFGVTMRKPSHDVADYVVTVPIARGFRVEMAGLAAPASWDELASQLIGVEAGGTEVLAYGDAAFGQHRLAVLRHGRLLGALFVGRHPLAMSRGFAGEHLGQPVAPEDRLRLLAGRAGGIQKDKGDIVCACLEVGRNEIIEAIVGKGARTVGEVGALVNAGTNCGSCRLEIGRLIDEASFAKAG